MCQHARMGDTMIQEAAPWKSESRWFQPFASPMQLQLWPRSFGSLGNTRMLTLPPSLRSWWWQTFRKWLVWRSSGVRAVFEWGHLNGFREVFTQWKGMKRTIILYYFCWCVEFPKGLVHTHPSKSHPRTMFWPWYQVRLATKFRSSAQLDLWSTCHALAAQFWGWKRLPADLWDKPHKHPSCNQDIFRWFPKCNKILRQVLMIIGWWSWATSLPKHIPSQKRYYRLPPKKMSCLQCFVTFGKPQFCATFGEQLKLAPHGWSQDAAPYELLKA